MLEKEIIKTNISLWKMDVKVLDTSDSRLVTIASHVKNPRQLFIVITLIITHRVF